MQTTQENLGFCYSSADVASRDDKRIPVKIVHHSLATLERDFGFADRFGRKIGAIVTIERVTVEATAARTDGGYDRYAFPSAVGAELYEATPHATRNGDCFGASQRGGLFTTLEEAEKYAEKYFAGAAKRAAKRDGK